MAETANPNMEKEKRLKAALLAACVVFLSAAIALFFMRQQEMTKRLGVEKRLVELNKEKIKLTQELDDTMLVKKDLEMQLTSAQEKSQLLERQAGDERRSREEAFAQLESEKRESKRLVDELIKTKDEKEQISLKLKDAASECDILKGRLSGIQQAKEILENKLKELLSRNEVELEKIVVKPDVKTSPQPSSDAVSAEGASADNPSGIKGEILVVNKKFNFAVVSLGSEHGLEPGASLDAYRNDKLITRLQVEKVHANMSAVKIPPDLKDLDIREGDSVIAVK